MMSFPTEPGSHAHRFIPAVAVFWLYGSPLQRGAVPGYQAIRKKRLRLCKKSPAAPVPAIE
jgi:hypothetical protein